VEDAGKPSTAKVAKSSRRTQRKTLGTESEGIAGLRTVLAASPEAAAVGDGHAEIFIGIDWSVVDADFVVKVRTGGPSAGANVPDGVAAMNLLSGRNREAGEVAVAGRDTMAMIHHNGLTISAHEVHESDYAIGGRDDRMSIRAAISTPL